MPLKDKKKEGSRRVLSDGGDMTWDTEGDKPAGLQEKS